jgi:glucokinase
VIHTDIYSKYPTINIIGISVGAPNGNHYTGEIVNAPNLSWKGTIPLALLFKEKFNIYAELSNDANVAAIGEHLFGNAKDLTDFVTITLGTGLGSGVFINGKIVYGNQGFAGEFGHIRVIKDGRLCGCGRKGCLETYASSTGVVRSITELDSNNKINSSLLNIEKPIAKDVFETAEKGDLFSIEIIEYTAEILGSSLADFACFSNPKAYVLFGGIAQSGPRFAERVKFYMEEHLLNILKDNIEIRISSLHYRNAAILGCAASVFLKLK